MTTSVAGLILAVLAAYGAAGLLVGVLFLLLAIGRIDPAAQGAYAFRPLLLPGLVLLWPYVLLRWWRFERAAR